MPGVPLRNKTQFHCALTARQSFVLYISPRLLPLPLLANKTALRHKKTLRGEGFFMAHPAGFELTTF